MFFSCLLASGMDLFDRQILAALRHGISWKLGQTLHESFPILKPREKEINTILNRFRNTHARPLTGVETFLNRNC
jgi:hypothetical protein